MKNRAVASILVTVMIICMLSASIPPAFAQGNTIIISSTEDFIKFSKNCTLDTWSQGKIVNLTCDIDFGDMDFSSVPTFGGTFNGNGHTISGISASENGSYVGLFRYVQQGGNVTKLNVEADFTPSGSKSFVGGIAGENSGVIKQCNFTGNVKGENVIGGIAGNNTASGQIISCSASGNVDGENSTGGIAGKNDGLILNCTNNAEINTVYEETKNSISNMESDTGAIIENYKNNKEENEEESVLGHSDTGGIAGYTSGIVQGCTNNSAVGYKHIGYNVGGIAGRQSGYLLGNKNFGLIQGRKDVGGIVGQTEPYIILRASESALQDIRQELNNLHSMINKFITDTDNLGDDAEKHLTNISEYSKNAQDNTEILLNQGTDFVDDNLGEINAQAAILSNTLDKLIPVFDSLENSCDDLADALDQVAKALDSIEIYAPDLSDDADNISSAVADISRAERIIKRAASRAGQACDDLNDVVEFNDKAQVKSAVSELSAAVNDIVTAKRTIKTALETIETTLKTKPDSFESIGINAKEIAENIKIIKDNVDVTISSLQTVNNSLDTVILNTEINFYEFISAAQNMQSAVEYLSDAMHSIAQGVENLSAAMENVSDKFNDYTDDISEQLNTAKADLSEAVTSLSYAADDIKTSISDIKQIITDLANEEPLEFVKLGDDFRNASENLFDSLSEISGEIDKLKNTASSGKNLITSDLTSISNQFNLVMNLMTNEFEELKNGNTDISEMFLDVSDEDIENTKQGKVAECKNFGNVEADRNTGGIAGAMAIEYSKDPEDDLEKPDTFNFTYRSKAILQACINDGEIIGKKDCSGGIVGFAEIGTVYECENYGNIESTNGNYVGGVAGKSESAIRKSYSKCKLTGKRYIGGIAGKADIVSACCSIVNVSGDENVGAVCGDIDTKDKLYQNSFVNSGNGAVDGISYKGKAEPVSFEKLKNKDGIPARFISFTVTFIADDEIVETKEIKYGDDTAKIKYPDIPPKDGHFGNWQRIEEETVTENIEVICEYEPYITVLSSVEKNENGKLALALAEGEFTDKAELHITESKEIPPKNAQGNVKVYDIALSDTDIENDDTVTFRLINENKDKVTAWQLKDGEWKEVKTTDRGKYVILNALDTKTTICMQYTKKGFNFIWLILIALSITACLCIIKFRKSKGKK